MKLNKIYNEDCLEGMQRIPDNYVDMILADLPYGTTACKWDSIIPLEPLWKQYKRVIKDNGAIVLTAIQPFTTKLINSNMEWFKYEWIWEKPNGINPFVANYQPMNNIENIIVFYKKQPTYNPQMKTSKMYKRKGKKPIKTIKTIGNIKDKPYRNNKRYPNRILKYKKPSQFGSNKQREKNSLHPTQKPVALFEYLIKTYTNKNEIVLDNTIGSGTTAVACLKTNRNFIGFETSKKYVNIANKRINKFKKEKYRDKKQKEKSKSILNNFK